MSYPYAYLDSYCYGPVDLLKICQGDSTLWLRLRDSAGKQAWAVYHNCIYRQLDQSRLGMHLSLVERVEAQDLLYAGSAVLASLRKNTDHVPALLLDWQKRGFSFFLHLGMQPGTDFLVVAQSLEYGENLKNT